MKPIEMLFLCLNYVYNMLKINQVCLKDCVVGRMFRIKIEIRIEMFSAKTIILYATM